MAKTSQYIFFGLAGLLALNMDLLYEQYEEIERRENDYSCGICRLPAICAISEIMEDQSLATCVPRLPVTWFVPVIPPERPTLANDPRKINFMIV
jgi:hypothetical protein